MCRGNLHCTGRHNFHAYPARSSIGRRMPTHVHGKTVIVLPSLKAKLGTTNHACCVGRRKYQMTPAMVVWWCPGAGYDWHGCNPKTHLHTKSGQGIGFRCSTDYTQRSPRQSATLRLVALNLERTRQRILCDSMHIIIEEVCGPQNARCRFPIVPGFV